MKKKNITYLISMIITILVIVSSLILIVGGNFGTAISGFLRGIIGNKYQIGEIFVKATPLMLVGLGCAVGNKTGFINLGSEGQLYIGAMLGSYIALTFSDMPKPVLIPFMILVGFVFGGLWALIPGFLKAKFKLSEVIICIMLNYIAINIVAIAVRTFLKDPSYNFPVSANFSDSATLSVLLPQTRLHTGIIIGLVASVIIYLFIWKTPKGFEMRSCGFNQRASFCSGIKVNRNVILSSLISGGLAGIAGVIEVAGVQHRLVEGLSPNYGYTAIIVALLGRNHPTGVVVAAIAIAMLDVGASSMQRIAGVPSSISSIILGLIVLLLIAKQFVMSYNRKKEA
ncbi:ABC transporter permease [Peptostreptococcaceae bacterium OttesenSCG-928-C18]|nr:ABC transporter permease [Peptostreptococcaceae bacterium OttesenSCG-928-C18]